MNYRFDTQYFAVTDNSILFLRNRFPYREVKSQDITKIELTKGTDVKRPAFSIIFGCILISASIFLIANFSGFGPSDLSGGPKASRTFGYLIVMEFFFLGLGGYSIYRAVPTHPVIKFTLTTGETESMAIIELIKNKKVSDLVTTLTEMIGSSRISVDRELGV